MKQTSLFGEELELNKVPEDKRNPEVQQIIDTLKEQLNLKILDGTHLQNRRFAYLLIKKFSLPTTLIIINSTAQNQFWSGKITSTMKLYYNAVAIMSATAGRSYGDKKISIDNTEF